VRSKFSCVRLSHDLCAHAHTHRFIHSFITEIYIVPLQGYYSETLPTLGQIRGNIDHEPNIYQNSVTGRTNVAYR